MPYFELPSILELSLVFSGVMITTHLAVIMLMFHPLKEKTFRSVQNGINILIVKRHRVSLKPQSCSGYAMSRAIDLKHFVEL